MNCYNFIPYFSICQERQGQRKVGLFLLRFNDFGWFLKTPNICSRDDSFF